MKMTVEDYLGKSPRKEVEAALGELMTTIKNAHTAIADKTGDDCQLAINAGFANIINAFLRYDAARLARGGET